MGGRKDGRKGKEREEGEGRGGAYF